MGLGFLFPHKNMMTKHGLSTSLSDMFYSFFYRCAAKAEAE